MDALEAEAAGLMGALAWAHEQARHREVLGLAYALRQAWNVRGRRDEELRLYAWAEQAAQELGDVGDQRWVAHEWAVIQSNIGRISEARAGYNRALALAQQLGNPELERREVHGLAALDGQTGRLTEARAGYERALALAQQLGDPAAERREVHGLSVMDRQMGQLAEARAGYERALALARQLGDPAAEVVELRDLGNLLRIEQQLDQARILLQQALEISTRLGSIQYIGDCHQFLAWVEADVDNRSASVAHDHEALRCFVQVQSPDAEDVRAHLRALEVEESFPPDVVRAVRAFLNIASWPETRAILEQEQALLLRDEVDQFLKCAHRAGAAERRP